MKTFNFCNFSQLTGPDSDCRAKSGSAIPILVMAVILNRWYFINRRARLCYLICLRHLIRSRTVKYWAFS